ncbi:hypothetical protein AQI84_09325 [Streptomyces griseorubiginosus]|nr:hypothetical protein AQI84_09325 [Streptomyces griseorubiginosus]
MLALRVVHEPEPAVPPRVAHLDTERVLREPEQAQLEVPSRHASVGHRVGGQLRDEMLRGVVHLAVVGVPPGLQPRGGEPAGQPGASRGRAQTLGQFVDGGGDFGVHETERAALSLR